MVGPEDTELGTLSGDTRATPHVRNHSRSTGNHDNRSSTGNHNNRGRKKTFREKARLLLESPKFHIAVLTLVVTELVMVVTELMIDASGVEKSPTLETVEVVLKHIGILILSVFVAENLFTMYVLRGEFFCKCLEVFDTVVVVTSLVLEVVFVNRHDAATGFGILIALRLWRVVRVINGIVVTVTAQSERKVEEERELREEAEAQLERSHGLSEKQLRYIAHLEEFIQSHGLQVPPPPSSPSNCSDSPRVAGSLPADKN